MKLAWHCPYCEAFSTIDEDDCNSFEGAMSLESEDGRKEIYGRFTVCPNPKCKRTVLDINLFKRNGRPGNYWRGDHIRHWRLIPSSSAHVLPAYIPKAIAQDYIEACEIKDLSPKASATLARRCLQGMIRDFHKIKKPTLKQEVDALQGSVSATLWTAIDGVRSLGNIGAHMEKDIDVIIDIDAGEAEKLIKLIELLVNSWYVAKHEEEENVKAVVELAQIKKEQKKQPQSM